MIDEFDIFEKRYLNLDSPKFEKLIYSDTRKEYVKEDVALTYFQSEAEFREAVIRGDLKLCFVVLVTLDVEYGVIMSDGFEPFWEKKTTDNQYDIGWSMQLSGYTKSIVELNFQGVVSPVYNSSFIKALFSHSNKKLELVDIYLIECFKKYKIDFYKEKEYRLNSERSAVTHVSIADCQFSLTELKNLQSVNNVDKAYESEMDENELICEKLLILRKERLNPDGTIKHVKDGTLEEQFYKLVPKIIIKLNKELRVVSDDLKKQAEKKNEKTYKSTGKNGLRSQVKERLLSEDRNFPKISESTFKHYWNTLMKDLIKC